MGLNTSMYQLEPQVQIESPVNQLGKLLQVQNAQQEGQMNRLKMDEYSKGVERTTGLRSLLSQSYDNPAAREDALLRGGYADESLKLGKDRRENAKSDADTDYKKLESEHKRTELIGQALGYVKDNPTPENARATIERFVQSGLMPAEFGRQKLAELERDPSPEGIRQRATRGYQEALSAKDQLPKYETRNTGGTTDTIAINPVTGMVNVTNSVKNTQSPDNIASNATSRSNNAATVGASYANAGATREIAKATRDAATIQTGFASEQGLRKEFEGLPEVKNYKQAYPAFAAIKDATSRNTTQSDINIVYGLAKLYDPTSVVREGEYATVANSPSIPEKVKGYAQFLAGGGRLSPETKRQILAEANGRIGTYKAEADKAKGSYEGIARKRGMDPSSVFADMGDIGSGAAPSAPEKTKSVNFGDLK